MLILLNWGRGVGGAVLVAAPMARVPVCGQERNDHEQREENCFHHRRLRKNAVRWTYLNAKSEPQIPRAIDAITQRIADGCKPSIRRGEALED